MTRFVAFVAVCAILVACGGNGDERETAGDAAERQMTAWSRAQYGPLWDDLHPAHQEMVSRNAYIDCKSPGGSGQQVDDIEVLDTYDEPLDVTGIGTIDTTAVSLRLAAGERSQNITMHLIDVDGSWRWIMADEDIEECGD